jgi:hypothetical protein
MTLTAAEIDALAAYSGAAYQRINRALRSGEDMDGDLRATVRLLDSAIAKHPVARRFTVYRGVGENYASELERLDLEEGDTIIEAAFLSTSTHLDVARQFLGSMGGGMILKIHVPAGGNALDMHPYSNFPEEHEFLLPRGVKLRAIGYDANADALEFEVVLNEQG